MKEISKAVQSIFESVMMMLLIYVSAAVCLCVCPYDGHKQQS